MEKLPEKLLGEATQQINLLHYDFQILMNRSKVVLEQYVISFLQEGNKKIHFADSDVQIDSSMALMAVPGNCLITEKGEGTKDYKSMLLFFSKDKLTDLLLKKGLLPGSVDTGNSVPYFVFGQDEFIKVFTQSLSLHFSMPQQLSQQLLDAKLEELMIYLVDKYGKRFTDFLLCSLSLMHHLSFKKAIESNKYAHLSIEETAFLCNMSVSTFKRRFKEVFNDTPGNWFKQKRLEKANQLLQSGEATPAELHHISGYKHLSHFSTAYKEKFGKSPKHHTIS